MRTSIGLVLPPFSAAQLPIVESFPAALITATGAVAANKAYLSRFRVGRAITITTMAFWVQSQSGNVDMGIYTSVDLSTFTRVASTGSTVVSGTAAAQAIALTASTTLVPGADYWIAIALDNATATTQRVNGATAAPGIGSMYISKTASFPLPASISSPSGEGQVVYVAGY